MRSWHLKLAAAAAVALASVSAAGQELDHFALNRFHPAPAGDRFFGVQGGDEAGQLQLPVMVLGDYAYRPLVLYKNDGDDRVGGVVTHQLYVHGALSLALWRRLVLSVDVPFAVVTKGDSPSFAGVAIASPSGAALGDIRPGLRIRLVGGARDALQLALAGYVWLPTGDEDHYAGDGKVRGMPALVVNGEAGSFIYALNGGVTLRPKKQFAATEVGNDLHVAAALGLLVANRKLQIGPELYSTTTLQNSFERDTTNIEGILGAKVRVGPVVLGAGAGPGFTRGLGTPALRALLSLAVVPETEQEVARAADRDQDGVIDALDACPDVPGPGNTDPKKNGCPLDRDGDGILDQVDACPDVPGVEDADPQKHGCPPDRDGDGIVDSEDACPDVKGVRDSDPKKNGCPPDRDRDGILDDEDACPDVKGVKNPDPQKNGCPPDSDGDGIVDNEDACPSEKGPADPDPKKNGCPSMVRVTKGEIVILQQVKFKTASDAILPESDELLTQVSNVLREHSEIRKIEVQGHTDNRGAAGYNKNLSQRRAASVVRWLVNKGKIEGARLTPKGYGMDQPITDNNSEDGRQLNRRVQFKILETSASDTPDTGAE